jgi:hypothetical protein
MSLWAGSDWSPTSSLEGEVIMKKEINKISAADPDPSDPYNCGPPESGSFYHQGKKVRKTSIPAVL